MFSTWMTGELEVGSPQLNPASRTTWMVIPTRVVTAQGSVWEVKTTSGLTTTPHGQEVVGVVVEEVVEPPGGIDEVLHAASRPPSVRATRPLGSPCRMVPGAPTPQVSHRGLDRDTTSTPDESGADVDECLGAPFSGGRGEPPSPPAWVADPRRGWILGRERHQPRLADRG
jgi:hypothetical protein